MNKKECGECGMPRPFDCNLSLHLDWCSKHNMDTCEACRELIENEEYEEMIIVRDNQNA